ncbi:hypothetical protein LC040_05955 [Bacillus tianshenii]|nr:hypothetical protein LC040_05955 [Bacillus tianshenii]
MTATATAQPRKLKRVVIKEEFFALTGDFRLAVLLNQMVYWAERVRDYDKFILEEKQRAEKIGEEHDQELNNGWIYKKASELVEETMLGVSEVTVRRLLNKLVEKGWVDMRTNPIYNWDKTKQYRVNLLKIEQELRSLGYTLQEYVIEYSNMQNEESSLQIEGSSEQVEGSTKQDDGSSVHSEGAIPEITTEITSNEINKNDDDKARVCSSSEQQQDQEQEPKQETVNDIEHAARELENKFIQLRGRGLYPSANDMQDIMEIVKSDIALEDALKWLEECFANYKPPYTGARINTFSYCKQHILQQAYLQKSRKEAKQNAKKVEFTEHQPKQRKPRGRAGYHPRKEKLPEWFEEEKQGKPTEQTQEDTQEAEQLKADLQKQLKAFRETPGCN